MAQTRYKTDCQQCGGRGFYIPKKEFRGAMLPDWAHPQNCPRCGGYGSEPDEPKKSKIKTTGMKSNVLCDGG